MDLGFEIVAEGARSKRPSDEPAPAQVPMRPRDQRRNPSTDQKRVRRAMQRKVAAHQCMCEHINHFPPGDPASTAGGFDDHPREGGAHEYGKASAGEHSARYVGPVCDWCAEKCMKDYLLPKESHLHLAAEEEHEKELTCPQCLQHVTVVLQPEGPKFTYNCPNCGYHGTIDAPKEATRRTSVVSGTAQDRARLLAEAARASTLSEQQRLVSEADKIDQSMRSTASLDRESSLVDSVVSDTLTPVRVHEMHTASTDWLGDSVPYSSPEDAQREMVAQASLWFGRTATFVKDDVEEFGEQARGMARRLAGQFGEHADVAERAFLDYTSHLQSRHAASGLPPGPSGQQATMPTGVEGYEGLPVEVTTSERAPQIEVLEQAGNGAPTQTSHGTPLGGASASRRALAAYDNGTMYSGRPAGPVAIQYPAHDSGNPHEIHCNHCGVVSTHFDEDDAFQAAMAHNESHPGGYPHGHPDMPVLSSRKEATMQCPTCAGQGRVAVRQAPVSRPTAASGLDQIDQVVDAFENPKPTPLPTEVMWPWEIGGNQQQQVQQETEQQIRQRGSRQQQAQAAAQAVYNRVLAGQDVSGWAGTGGGPTGVPGVQDGGNAPSSNLGQPDDVYGYGGTNQDQPLKPYGADEANDVTNNPGMGYQVGQPTQYDMGGRQQSTGAKDPQIAAAERFIAQRSAFLSQRG